MVNTTDISNASYHAALQVAQQAIAALVKWADASEQLPLQSDNTSDLESVTKAKTIFEWTGDMQIGTLRLLFDFVKLAKGKEQSEKCWYPMQAIADTYPAIPYPLEEKPDPHAQTKLKEQIQTEVIPVLQNQDNWNNLALLSLILEKYGSCLSFGEDNVALVDLTRMTGAVAAALAQNTEASHLSLVAGDLSGIQKFIYTISSEGALKSLRARSFYLELVTQEIVERLLKKLELPRTNIIYSGGGNLYLIAPEVSDSANKIDRIRDEINNWMLGRFQGRIFLALNSVAFPVKVLRKQASDGQQEKTFSDYWTDAIQTLAQQKLNRFNTSDQMRRVLSRRRSHDPCKVCHRDNAQNLKPLNKPDSPEACSTCREMFRLGGRLFKVEAVVRKRKEALQPMVIDGAFTIATIPGYYYYLFEDKNRAFSAASNPDAIFLINSWNIQDYSSDKHFPLLLGNYGQKSEQEEEENYQDIPNFMRAGEFAQKSAKAGCIPRVGYLRMDVDRLGQIFAQGLGGNYSLPRLAGLSRQMSYFFKVYLNSLAEKRRENFLDYKGKNKLNFESLTDGDRPNLLFIYAGGDDLFISGAWNEVVEFAFDVYQSFRAYTGNNPDITLSGGISIDDIKFPLYQSAESSGKAEDQAKGNGRNSLGLFGTVFKWKQWLGATDSQAVEKLINELDDKAKKYLNPNDQPGWLGILPFVKPLYTELKPTRSFVRNLLITAELQEQAINEKQKQIEQIKKKQAATQNTSDIAKLENEQEEIRYYLHLPKIAYTLARLPDRLRKEDSFKPIRTSLKSPYNAPYFRAIATWIELLTRNTSGS